MCSDKGDCATPVRIDGSGFDGDSYECMARRMFMRGVGADMSDRRGPVIGIASSWTELGSCNAGLRELATHVKKGIIAAGGWPIEFPTISLTEPFAKPTTMLLRNLMALDVEEMISSSPIDGVVLLNGCDKTVAAQLLGGMSADKPMLSLGAGPRPTVKLADEDLTIDELWEVVDRRRSGLVPDAEWQQIEEVLVSGPGTCNVLGTAISMAAVAEVLGLALPGSTLPVSGSGRRNQLGFLTGQRIVELATAGDRPQSTITEKALENAFRVNCALGGSTNVVIHLTALAGRMGIKVDWSRWTELAKTTPLVAGVRPVGPATLEQFDLAGGVVSVVAAVGSLLDLDQSTALGATWNEYLDERQQVESACVRVPKDGDPVAPGFTLLSGSLAPTGAVLKVAGANLGLLQHQGRAVVFESMDDVSDRIDDPALDIDKNCVIVVRNMGPIGANGMPEIGAPPIPRKLRDEGVIDMVRITDGRVSGTASGTVIVHAAPEASVGGPIGLVKDGDEILLDVLRGRLELLVSDEELEERRNAWRAPAAPKRGWSRLYHTHVLQADKGCDFDLLTL